MGVTEKELKERVTDLAHRGLVFDIEFAGQYYVALAPVVIGFFEFTFMRTGMTCPWQN
nr:hypothetical protein [Desulforamulus aquiferis]